MHGCIMIGAVTFRALHGGLTVFGEVGDQRTAFETYSFLLEEGLSVAEEFVSECSAFFERMRFVVYWTVLVRVATDCRNIHFVH